MEVEIIIIKVIDIMIIYYFIIKHLYFIITIGRINFDSKKIIKYDTYYYYYNYYLAIYSNSSSIGSLALGLISDGSLIFLCYSTILNFAYFSVYV